MSLIAVGNLVAIGGKCLGNKSKWKDKKYNQ